MARAHRVRKLMNGEENTQGMLAFSALTSSNQLTLYMRTFLGYYTVISPLESSQQLRYQSFTFLFK